MRGVLLHGTTKLGNNQHQLGIAELLHAERLLHTHGALRTDTLSRRHQIKQEFEARLRVIWAFQQLVSISDEYGKRRGHKEIIKIMPFPTHHEETVSSDLTKH